MDYLYFYGYICAYMGAFSYYVLGTWNKISVKRTLNIIFIPQKGIKCAIFVKKVEKIGPK